MSTRRSDVPRGRRAITLALCAAATLYAAIAAAEPLKLDVAHAEQGFDQRTNEPIVGLQWTESSRRAVADFTGRNVAKRIQVRVDGRVLMETVIREPILGGSGQIAGKFTVEQAKDYAKRLSAGTKVEIEAMPD